MIGNRKTWKPYNRQVGNYFSRLHRIYQPSKDKKPCVTN